MRRLRALDGRGDWSTKREARLVERVLARTTRLEPGLRGDLRLVGDFVRSRVAGTSYLRAAAALLLVHCFVVVPALALVLLRQEPDRHVFTTGILPPPAPAPEEAAEELELEVPADLDVRDAVRDAQHNLRRRARFRLLTQTGLPTPPARVEDPSGVEPARLLFDERLRLLAGAGGDRTLEQLAAFARTPAERSLLALLALDRATVLERRPAALGPLLNALALAETGGDLDALGRHVLARARALGEWPNPAASGIVPSGDVEDVLPLGAAEERALRAVFGERLDELRRR